MKQHRQSGPASAAPTRTEAVDSRSFPGGSNAERAEALGIGSFPGGTTLEDDLAWASELLGQDLTGTRVERGGARDTDGPPDAVAWTRDGVVHLPTTYRPGTDDGRELLVHELVHVIQQGGAGGGVLREATPAEAALHLDTARQVILAALDAIDDGRVLAQRDEDQADPDEARAPLLDALSALAGLDDPSEAATAAEVSFVLLEGAGAPEARDAKQTAEGLTDLDGGADDPLEREASRTAKLAVRGQVPGAVHPDPSAPATQRMAQALALPPAMAFAAAPWVLAAAGALLFVGAVAVLAGATASQRATGKNRGEPKTDAEPRAVPQAQSRPDSERRDWGLMRFQVQWDTKGSNATFAVPVIARGPEGVTVAQASAGMRAAHAQVSPRKAAAAATPAVDKALRWIQAAPLQGGVSMGGQSKSFRFRYMNFTDARADVENIKGHNLRM